MTALLRSMVTNPKPCAIGIDIGGTKIAAGVVTPRGEILQSVNVLTPARQGDVVRTLLTGIENLRSCFPGVVTVGVGAAGMVDWPSGNIRWAPNTPFENLPLGKLLVEGTGLPVVIENDANAAAWAEASVGAGAGLSNVLVLTVGTGIGAGVILGGELQRGHTGIAGEAGHMHVNPTGGDLCACGATGCLEAMASGTALGRAGRDAAASDPAGHLTQLAGGAENVTGETVYQAALDGDPTALSLFGQIGYWLGVGIASLVNIFDPQIVVLAGGLTSTGDLLLGPTGQCYERFVFARQHRQLPPLTPARMGPEAGLIGAALLALGHEPASRQPPGSAARAEVPVVAR